MVTVHWNLRSCRFSSRISSALLTLVLFLTYYNFESLSKINADWNDMKIVQFNHNSSTNTRNKNEESSESSKLGKIKTTIFINSNNTENDEESCWRHCPQRINKIYYEHGEAGLGDRHSIIHNLAQIAGYLCAELEMPPPYISLTPAHNDGKNVSENVKWQDFRNLTFKSDKSQVISLDPSFGDGFDDWLKVPVYGKDKHKDWLHIVTDGPDKLKDYKKLEEFSWRQKDDATIGFIWEIRSSWFHSDLFEHLLPEPSKVIRQSTEYRNRMRPFLYTYRHFHPAVKKDWGCLYTDDDDIEPSHMNYLRKRLKRRVQRQSPENPVYGYFHIRRGDTIEECDTSLEALQDYMACSLRGTETTGKSIVFLMGSDEKDYTYRQNVIDLANNLSHVSILDADKLTTQVIREAVSNGLVDEGFENNFYVYELQKVLTRKYNFSTIFLDKHRSDCNKCLKLMEAFPDVWK